MVYLTKNDNQRALATRSVSSKEKLGQLLEYQQEVIAKITDRKQQEGGDRDR